MLGGSLQNHPEIAYVAWPSGSEMLQIPVIDVTHPSFALEDTAASRAALDANFLAEERRNSRRPRFITYLMLRGGARKSRLLHSLVHAPADYCDSLTTYLVKLGPQHLPAGFNTPLDQKVVSTPHVISIRVRLQQCAYLLADRLTGFLESLPAVPLHLFNVAGGTAIDSLNALIVLRQRRPELLQRPIRILVLDIDPAGPAFGALATAALKHSAQALAGVDVELVHEAYDWNDAGPLALKIERSRQQGAIVAVSAEGGLFEYGDDPAVIANLRAMTGDGSAAPIVVGSITRPEPDRQARMQRANFKLYPRTLEAFDKLARQAGFETTRVEESPISYQVLLERVTR
jgi:hypothetical protein